MYISKYVYKHVCTCMLSMNAGMTLSRGTATGRSGAADAGSRGKEAAK